LSGDVVTSFILSVKRVIRNRTGLYWTEDGSWSSDYQEAWNFAHIADAVAAKQRYQIKEVDLVLLLHDVPTPAYDVILHLNDGV
jgi:hypothetical protein